MEREFTIKIKYDERLKKKLLIGIAVLIAIVVLAIAFRGTPNSEKAAIRQAKEEVLFSLGIGSGHASFKDVEVIKYVQNREYAVNGTIKLKFPVDDEPYRDFSVHLGYKNGEWSNINEYPSIGPSMTSEEYEFAKYVNERYENDEDYGYEDEQADQEMFFEEQYESDEYYEEGF